MNASLDAMPASEAWRTRVVGAVVDSLYQQHPALSLQFGERGAVQCRQDIRRHLDYLDGALLADEPVLFTDYAIWLRRVLESRNIPVIHLLESFELLAGVLMGELPLAQATGLKQILAAGRDALLRDDSSCPYLHARLPPLPEAGLYLAQVMDRNQSGAEQTIKRCMQAGASLTEVSVLVVQPAMVEIGRLWQDNRLTVAQEHMATAMSQNLLARAYGRAAFMPQLGRKLMLACVAGNHHGLGLRILCDAFETIGWEVSFLGTDVPTADLIRQIDIENPDMLCLSLSLPAHLPLARGILEKLRAELGNRCPSILVGGQVTLTNERVWHAVKADGWASDAMHALKQFST